MDFFFRRPQMMRATRVETRMSVRKKNFYRPFAWIAFCLASLLFQQADAKEKLIFSGVEGSPDTQAAAAVLKEAYHRQNVEIEFHWLPGQTALAYANSGQTDGELQRIDGIERRFSNLVQIPIPINYLPGVVFSKHHDFPINGWYSLKSYRVGIVKGILFAEQGTQGMNVTAANTYSELMSLLENGEIDLAIMPRINGQVTIKKLKLEDIEELDGTLETLFLYHYLHKKNRGLIPQIEEELKRMLLDGTIKRIRDEVYAHLLAEGE